MIKMKIKRIIALFVALIVATTVFAACAKEKNDIKYREAGLEFVLPRSMRRAETSAYDFYFSTLDAIFAVIKLDDDYLASVSVPNDITAEGYINEYIKRNYLDKKQIDFKHDPERNAYSLRYNYSEEGNLDVFHYVIVLGEPGALWYVEMCCDNEDSGTYTTTFELWGKSVKTYKD